MYKMSIDASFACCKLPLFQKNTNCKEMVFSFDKSVLEKCKCSVGKRERKMYECMHAVLDHSILNETMFDTFMYSMLYMIKVTTKKKENVPSLFKALFQDRNLCKCSDFVKAGKWCQDRGYSMTFLFDATVAFLTCWLRISVTLVQKRKEDKKQFAQLQCMMVFYKETMLELSYYYAGVEKASYLFKKKEEAQIAKQLTQDCIDAMNETSLLLSCMAKDIFFNK